MNEDINVNDSKEYKKFLNSIIALTVIYVQFILNDYTLSKEYFINLIFILLLLNILMIM